MVQLLDLPAGNLEQLVSCANNKLYRSPHSTDRHLGCAIGICILDRYIGWLCMCCGVPGTSPNWQTALLQNSPPNWEFQSFQNYVDPGV